MDYKKERFKIGVTFSGRYRKQYIEPICNFLLKLGYKKDDIFYDLWHDNLINGYDGDRKLRQIYNEQCDCIVVLLSPDYKQKNWTGHIEWPAIKELINAGKGDKLCLLGIDNVDINKVDGLYINQAIIKFIDEMTPEGVADFINKKYLQNSNVTYSGEKIVKDESKETAYQYTQFILDETNYFIRELKSLNVVVSTGNTINIIEQLKNTPREGKRTRLSEISNTIIKPRSVYEHIISLAYLADVIGSLIKEERWSATEMARLIAYHEIAEAIIGDIASYTVSEPMIKGPDRFETSKREIIVNKFISLYADSKQQESIGYLNNRIKPTGRRKDELTEQMEYFKALDHLDCLVAIWRYLFHYREQCTKEQRIEFIDVMRDFFTNQRLKEEDVFNRIPIFKEIIFFLSNRNNAKKYVAGDNIKDLFKGNTSVLEAVTYLIENVSLFCDK